MKAAVKYIIITLFTVELSLVCLFFPSELSKWKDRKTIGTVNLEQMEATNIEYSQQTTMLEKLDMYLFQKKGSNAIALNQGKFLTKDDIPRVCREEIDKLKDMGLEINFEVDFEKDLNLSELYFYISTEDPTKSMIMWTAIFSNSEGTIMIDLDDETGKILSITQKSLNEIKLSVDSESFINRLADYYGIEVSTQEELENSDTMRGKFYGLRNFVIFKQKEKYLKCTVNISSFGLTFEP
jgi:gamma-glutamylcyclotransferase (GGCT)/AIG2-like uncharacterized protein YtfP